MKAIMISKPPKIVANILNRSTSILVFKNITKEWKDYLKRKTNKIPKPIDVYIYCTKNKEKRIGSWLSLYCDSGRVTTDIKLEDACYQLNGKVIGEFVCNHITNIEVLKSGLFTGGNPNGHCVSVVEKSMLSPTEIKDYAKNKTNVFGWHISNLVIYDKPKELGEFKKHNRTCYYDHLGLAIPKCKDCKDCQITRPPQSWCYVESEVEGE